MKNGVLIARAEADFDIFLTCDKNLCYQQNLAHRRIALLVLSTNTWSAVRVNAPKIAAALSTLRPGDYRELSL